jgi:hypothetical protein
MKNLFLKKTNSLKSKKDGQVNHHHFWIVFMVISLIVLILEIVFFTYLFIVFSKKLDAPVLPRFDTNSAQINNIDKIIEKTEKSILDRSSVPSTSQNSSLIVQ